MKEENIKIYTREELKPYFRTYTELAKFLNVSPSDITKYKNGIPSKHSLKIQEYLKNWNNVEDFKDFTSTKDVETNNLTMISLLKDIKFEMQKISSENIKHKDIIIKNKNLNKYILNIINLNKE